MVTVLAARLDEVSLAAHGIAVNVIATTFMVPLGISSAAAVRVGQAFGRKDPRGAALAGWTALLLERALHGQPPAWRCGWCRDAIVRVYIRDPAVIAGGAVLLRIAAVVPALRRLAGRRHRRAARPGRHAHPHAGAPGRLLGDRAAGQPTCSASRCGWGAPGIWVGLSAALILIGSALVAVWAKAVRRPVR